MANEAFALSARAASPTDADFEAIREAFAETARGRWFLDEYTKRNRNADTAMVLDAVARIERTLAAQKEDQKPQPSNELPDAMAAVKVIVTAARDNALEALAGPVIEEALAPSRKCARVIREIAWGLRESGADGRICSLLDSQVEAINAACDHVAAGGLRDGVLQAFDLAARQIDDIAPSDSVTSFDETPAPEAAAENYPVNLTLVQTEPPADIQAASVADDMFEAAEIEASPAAAIADPVLLREDLQPATAQFDMSAEAEASIETVAMEPAKTVHLTVVAETAALEPSIHETAVPGIAAEQVAVPVAEAAPMSLGASLIASGIVGRTAARLKTDLLAPIRRMSQAEKVAFFS